MVGADAWLKKIPSEVLPHVSSRPDYQSALAWMLESRAERSALGAAPDVAVVDVGLNFHGGRRYFHAVKLPPWWAVPVIWRFTAIFW